MPSGFAVTDEEPSPRGATRHGFRCQRRNLFAQHPVHRRGAGVELRVQPLRSRRKRAADQERRGRSRFERHGRFRGAARERHDQLVKEASFRSFRAQLVRRRKELGEHDLRTTAHELDHGVERERVFEIDEQLVVAFRETQVAGHPPRLAKTFRQTVTLRSRGVRDRPDLGGRDAPACAGEDQAAAGDTRQERREVHRSPIPLHADGRLDRREKPVDAEAFHRRVVRRGDPRDDLAIETARAEADAIARNRHHQILDRDLPVRRRAGAAEERDLMAAQDRAREDVADPPGRQVHDLREDCIRMKRLLVGEVLPHSLVDVGIGVAETAEHARAGRSLCAEEKHAKVAALDRLRRFRAEHGHRVKGLGHRRTARIFPAARGRRRRSRSRCALPPPRASRDPSARHPRSSR